MTPESIKRELADVEASLDDAISYLVDLAGAKPTPMSPHNCRIHLDHARMYAMRLADAAIESLSAQIAQPQAGEAVAWQNIETPSSILTPEQYGMRLPAAERRFRPLYASPQPANPAQVTDAAESIAAMVAEWYDRAPRAPHIPPEIIAKRLARFAALGAGGQAVALSLAEKALAILTRWTGEAYLFSAHEISKAVGAPKKSTNKALSGLIAIGRVERVQCTNGTFYKLAALSQPHPADERVVEAPRPNWNGWRSIDTAPEDCRVILATVGNWVGEAIMLRDEDTGEQIWTWVDTGKPSRHSCYGWMPLPEPLSAPVPPGLRPDGFDGPTGAE